MTASKIFISYSRKNQSWLDRFRTHLGVFAREGLLDVWEDRRIAIGSAWLSGIEKAINEAQAAIFLISAEFLTSEFICGQEVPRLLKRRAREGLHLFPILIHECCWEDVSWLARLQIWPVGGRPLASFRGEQRNAQTAAIAREIRKIVVAGDLAPKRKSSRGWSPKEVQSLIHSLETRSQSKKKVPSALAQAVSCLLDSRVPYTSRSIVAGLLSQVPREHALFVKDQLLGDVRSDPLVLSVLKNWGIQGRVLIVDDQVGDLLWLINFIQDRGYEIVLASDEVTARQHLDAVRQGVDSFTMVILDVIIPIRGIMELVTLDQDFFESSQYAGIRLCRYAREELGLSESQLPIACLTVREDDEIREVMRNLKIPLFNKSPRSADESIRSFLESHLPPVAEIGL